MHNLFLSPMAVLSASWVLLWLGVSAAYADTLSPVPIQPLGAGGDDLQEGDADLEPRESEQAAELSPTLEELRSRHFYAASLAIGGARPWQAYTVELAYLSYANATYALFAGGGDRHDSGVLDERSYDLRLSSHSVGAAFRFHPMNFERLSIDSALSLIQWSGRLTPHGSDDAAQTPDDRLSSSVRAKGAVLAVAAVFSWLWDGGLFLEWTPVGAYKSQVLQHDFTRASSAREKAVIDRIEAAQIYGLTNIRVGYLF